MFRRSFIIFLFATLIILAGSLVLLSASVPPGSRAYVEPGLWSTETESLAVIVTARSSDTAAAIVERLGGQTTSDLWLIDAVAATLPADQLG